MYTRFATNISSCARNSSDRKHYAFAAIIKSAASKPMSESPPPARPLRDDGIWWSEPQNALVPNDYLANKVRNGCGGDP